MAKRDDNDIKLAIRIAGEIDKSLGDSIDITKKKLRSLAIYAAKAEKNQTFGTAVSKMSSGIDRATDSALRMTKTIAGAAAGAGVALAGLGAASINAGSDFESAFAGIRKTVDATEQEYSSLEESIRNMAKDMPMTAVELSSIGEAAGQLGIQTENLEGFIKTMADLSVATNLTSDEGASEFAKFANITGMDQDKFDELGSTVVDLGNKMATTEADIVAMGMRLAGAGTQIGMSEADIMGFSAALSSVGIEAEMGGSALSKVMVDMQLAAETGSEALGTYANVAGMTAKEFQSLFKEDSAEAIIAFLSGLNDTERLGKSAIAVLDDMEIREVRLRDTLLRASSASDLFEGSLDIANTAFEENTALTKEAEQRYKTFESRLEMVQNRVTDVGISLYQDFRDPLSEVMGLALDATEDLKIFDDDTIEKMAEAAQEHIPTAVREIKEGANAFSDFAGPLMGSVINNLDLVGSGITGIGTAIVTLNVIKKIHEMSKAFGAMKLAMIGNPWTLAVGGIAALTGAIAAVTTKMKLAREEAKKANLAEHFGDISLSLEELEEAARQIVDNGNLNKLNLSMEELEKTSEIADDIRKASEEIEKLNWKITTGFELTDPDIELLTSSVDSIVSNAINLIQQSNYTATISVKALFGEDDETGNQIIEGFDSMYQQINEEVAQKGQELGEAYRKAMEDKVIEPFEMEQINQLKEELEKLTNEVAESLLNAKIERLAIQSEEGILTAESLKNLSSEVQEVIQEKSTSREQSADYALAQLEQQREKSLSGEIKPEDEAYLSETVYQERKSAVADQLFQGNMQDLLTGLKFSTDAIAKEYEEDINQAIQGSIDEVIKNIEYGNNTDLLLTDESIKDVLKNQLGNPTIDAITEMWEGAVEAQYNQLRELVAQAEEEGRQIPDELMKAAQEALSDADVIGDIAGKSMESTISRFSEELEDSTEFQTALEKVIRKGNQIPEALGEGIESNQIAIDDAVKNVYIRTWQKVEDEFSKTIDTDVDISLKLKPVFSNKREAIQRVQSMRQTALKFGSSGQPVTLHAEGGIFDQPHLGLVAEAGPEAVIPLNGSNNAKSLWQRAGEALGLLAPSNQGDSTIPPMTGSYEQGGDTYHIIYSPVLQGASEETLQRAARMSLEEFDRYMQQYLKSKRRTSLSPA